MTPLDADRQQAQQLTADYLAELQLRFGQEPSLRQALLEPLAHCMSGGKQWRAAFAMVCSRAVCGEDRTGRLALVPELLHHASLAVDDVEDGSALRRGRAALHVRFGTDVALNAANGLYFLALQLIDACKLGTTEKARLVAAVHDDMVALHLGQATDIIWHRRQSNASETDYFLLCARKTGSLARLAARVGAAASGASSAQSAALCAFAETLGIAFQLQDDVRNLRNAAGKTAGDDIAEGKMSLPVIHALSTAPPEEKQRLLAILAMHTADARLVAEAIAIIEHAGALTSTLQRATAIAASARQHLNGTFDVAAQNLLADFSTHILCP